MPELPTGTVTFLFTDIEGSTRLLRALGTQYRQVLERHSALVREGLAEHDGMAVGTEGDSFFAVFRSATDALAAVAAIQRSLAAEEWPAGGAVRVRMGLHTGEGRLGGDNYVGLDVHRAARIAAAAHGGQVLLSAATRVVAGAELPEGVGLRDVGTHRLRDLEHPEALWQLLIDGLEHTFPPIRTLETPQNLPVELTSFVGRARELAEVSALLEANRLVTMTGPGGTGKTRLALRVAKGMGARFPDGAFFVDLAPLTDSTLVGPTIARTLGLTDQAERPIMDQLTAYMGPREILLVLDNFEQVLAGRGTLDELLATAPRVKFLATSRTGLDLYGEQVYPVPSLRLPDRSETSDPESLLANEAVSLFVERARAARPSFTLTKERAAAVSGICVRLDGLPLAIELAATRVRVLEPAEILARLDQRLPVLTSGGSNVPVRQRTLRATIAWSYDLLEPSEQALFARLAIFVGGCTLDAAEAVCDLGGELGIDTLDGLSSLVSQSLVRQVEDGGESRFGMLETIREYGRDQLEHEGLAEEIVRRHVAYYRDLAETAEPQLVGSQQVVWLDRFEREHDNVRLALRQSMDTADPESGLRLAAAVWRFWFQRGYLREGRTWLEELLRLEPDVVSAARAKAYGALGGLCYWLADVDATERAYSSALRLYRELGDREAEAQALYDLAFIPVLRGDNKGTERRFQESIGLSKAVGRRDLVAQAQAGLAIASVVAEDPRAALSLFDEALGYFREVGDRFHLADTLAGVAQAHRLLGNHTEGRMAYLEGLRIFTEARNLPSIGMTFEEIAALESAAGRHAEAARLLAAAGHLRQTTGARAPLSAMRLGDVEAEARREIGDEAVDQALREGAQMTLEDAVAYAESLAE